MRKLIFLFLVLAVASIWFRSSAWSAEPTTTTKVGQTASAPSTAASAEDWKGASREGELTLSALTGMGWIDTHNGFTLMGAIAKKIIPRGFVPDINDSVWLEVELGPLFVHSDTVIAYDMHLRWDFIKDDAWTFFGTGGLGGHFNTFAMHPSFGAGAIWDLYEAFSLRAEVNSSQLLAGVQFNF